MSWDLGHRGWLWQSVQASVLESYVIVSDRRWYLASLEQQICNWKSPSARFPFFYCLDSKLLRQATCGASWEHLPRELKHLVIKLYNIGSKVWASFKKKILQYNIHICINSDLHKSSTISYNVSVWSLMSRDLMGQLEIQSNKYVCIGTKTILYTYLKSSLKLTYDTMLCY